jgi:hypothetical protein
MRDGTVSWRTPGAHVGRYNGGSSVADVVSSSDPVLSAGLVPEDRQPLLSSLPPAISSEGVVMPFKCVACRTRMHRVGGSAELVGDPCPGCGYPLEPAGALAEVVGYRSITPRNRAVDGGAAGPDQPRAARVGDFTARRNAIHAQARRDALDAARWIDEGGSFRVEAVALPPLSRADATD